MSYKSIQSEHKSSFIQMGNIKLRQPLPNSQLKHVDPFILLHHYGPYKIDIKNNPFNIEPHPHRGFEPITFLIKGEQLHRDSLGNEFVIKPGDVQWITAGKGLIHSEGPTSSFIEKGGILEGIQLWLNLPSNLKMIEPNYQLARNEEIPNITSKDGRACIKVIAGTFEDQKGPIATQTSVQVLIIELKADGKCTLSIPQNHNALLYLIHGDVIVNHQTALQVDAIQMLTFNQEDKNIFIKANAGSKLLLLSGTPFQEPIATYGPYVMNTHSEIMEALRDYQSGDMGTLAPL